MISGVVLAAGTSSRLGRPKQLLPLRGRPILQHVVDTAHGGGLDETVVVLGHAAEEVARALRLPREARTVVNPDYPSGQASSLRAGLDALSADARAAVVLLGDQPGLSPDAVRAVVEGYRRTGGPVVQAAYSGRPGHPVLLDRGVWDAVRQVTGDVGARELLAERPDWVTLVDLGGDPPADLDTWEDYERLGGRAGG